MIGSLSKLYHVIGAVLILALLLCLYLFNPGVNNFFPECAFQNLFALDCPGCGSQRAISSLLHGEFSKAADYNLMLVISIPLLVIHIAYKRYLYLINKEFRFNVLESRLTKCILIGLFVAFWILRNIPTEPFSYLGA